MSEADELRALCCCRHRGAAPRAPGGAGTRSTTRPCAGRPEPGEVLTPLLLTPELSISRPQPGSRTPSPTRPSTGGLVLPPQSQSSSRERNTHEAGRSCRRSMVKTTASSPADRKVHGESGSRASWKINTRALVPFSPDKGLRSLSPSKPPAGAPPNPAALRLPLCLTAPEPLLVPRCPRRRGAVGRNYSRPAPPTALPSLSPAGRARGRYGARDPPHGGRRGLTLCEAPLCCATRLVFLQHWVAESSATRTWPSRAHMASVESPLLGRNLACKTPSGGAAPRAGGAQEDVEGPERMETGGARPHPPPLVAQPAPTGWVG